MKRALLAAFVLLFVLLLAACAPSSSDTQVEIQQLNGPVSFYPQEAGATWQYLPTGSSLSSPKITQMIEGPTVVDGDLWVVTRLEGLGLDNRMFRKYGSSGVLLLQELRPGQEVTYDPPVQEFPSEGEFRVGASWGGDTRASVYFPTAKPENQRRSYDVEYRYTVVDRRQVNVQAGNYEAYVIDFVARFLDEDRNVIFDQQLTTWFTPHVGEIKTENDFYLIATNASR